MSGTSEPSWSCRELATPRLQYGPQLGYHTVRVTVEAPHRESQHDKTRTMQGILPAKILLPLCRFDMPGAPVDFHDDAVRPPQRIQVESLAADNHGNVQVRYRQIRLPEKRQELGLAGRTRSSRNLLQGTS